MKPDDTVAVVHLLVSVGGASEAAAAVVGGADLVDAKNPRTGALGAVSLDVLREIHTAVAARRPVTAALGDAIDEETIERKARQFAAARTRFVKVGFAGVSSAARLAELARAACRGAEADGRVARVILVAYADADQSRTITRSTLIEIAARAGARGVLLDTADKRGPGLTALVDPRRLSAWVAHAHSYGLLVALAGKLSTDDLPIMRDAGADIAGVRGAACDGGRTGHVSADRVRQLHVLCGAGTLRAARPYKAPRNASI